MKSKKLLPVVVSGSILLSSVSVFAAIDMDYNSDNTVDVFDMISARQKSASKAELERLSSFLHGKNAEPKQESENGYTLIWSDEFDGNSIDASKWSYELGNWKLDENGNYVTGGWGNDEQEFYTDKNASVKDGVLTIAARKENITDEVQGSYEYTSSKLTTQHKFSTCGGRIEVRARCDSGKSLWPAIWMLPEDSAYGGWAASGEIDIMEGWGSTPEKICGTIHFGDVWPNNTYLTNDYKFKNDDSTENWHTYSIEWDRNEMRWYVDDELYSTQSDWYSVNHAYPAPFDQNFYIILNYAIGGKFDGVDGIHADPSIFADGEKHMDIDYVRVYDKEEDDFTPTEVTSLPLGSYIEGADAGVSNKDGCSVIHIENVGSLEYGVMGLIRGQKVKAGQKYTFEFDVSSTVGREMIVTAEDSEYTRYIDEKLTISPDRKHYSFDVTFDTDMSVDLKFQLGNIGNAADTGAHDVTISDIKWTAESSSLPLELYTEETDADIKNNDGFSVMHIENVGSLEYGVMGLIRGNNVKAGEIWALEFDASSTAEREMIVTCEDSEYIRYFNEKLIVAPDSRHYTINVKFADDMPVDLKFQLGNIGNAADIGAHDVTISNIKWTKI